MVLWIELIVKFWSQLLFNRKWNSHKSNRAALRYEVGICISNGDVIWIHGPFAAGRNRDLSIFRAKMKDYSDVGERVISDGGCNDPSCILKGELDRRYLEQHQLIRAKHERVNRRFKEFKCISAKFLHNLEKHSSCFFALANIVPILFEDGQMPF